MQIPSRAKDILRERVKKPLYRQWFRWGRSRFDYPRLAGRVCTTLRRRFIERVAYPQSICNAGLARTADGYLAVFKNQMFTLAPGRQPHSSNASVPERKRLYIVQFDKNWNVNGFAKLNATEGLRPITDEEGLEDARLFSFNGTTWVYATIGGHTTNAWPCIGPLHGDAVCFVRPTVNKQPPQKNWMPFEYDGNLYLEYQVSPRRILRYDVETGRAQFIQDEAPSWFAGTIHGGAPPVRLSDKHFLGVANVQHRFWYQERYYSAVFYLFDAVPPFHVRAASPPLRLVSRTPRVQYVTGMVVSENRGRRDCLLSIGVNDYDNVITRVDLEAILKRLNDV